MTHQPVQDVGHDLEIREGYGQMDELVVSIGLLNCCCYMWSCSSKEPAVSLGSAALAAVSTDFSFQGVPTNLPPAWSPPA